MSQFATDLRQIKRTLRGKSERIAIRDEVARRWAPRPLEILDIGVGDGLFIERLSKLLLAAGYFNEICGIDPDPEPQPSPNEHIELIRGRFEDCAFKKQFDVVLATHSFYYLGPAHAALLKIHSLLRDGGVAFLTMISEKCILYEISCVAQHRPYVFSAEVLQSEAERLDVYSTVSLSHVFGTICLEPWIRRPGLLRAAWRIFSRDLTQR